jgi:hypothetical protein
MTFIPRILFAMRFRLIYFNSINLIFHIYQIEPSDSVVIVVAVVVYLVAKIQIVYMIHVEVNIVHYNIYYVNKNLLYYMLIFLAHLVEVKINMKFLLINNYCLILCSLAPFYIAADGEKKTIIVSIRGTLSATDILTDINIVEDVLETELFGNGYCHSGNRTILFTILEYGLFLQKVDFQESK